MSVGLQLLLNTGEQSPLVFLNPFCPNVPFLYPMKTSEKLWFSDVSGVEKDNIGLKWVNKMEWVYLFTQCL